MAKGFPDYFGQSVWPKYGVVINDNIAGLWINVPGTWIITARLGQGVLSHFELRAAGAVDLVNIELVFTLDGEIIQREFLLNLLAYNAIPGSNAAFVCRSYLIDPAVSMIVELTRDIPFGQSIDVSLIAPVGVDATIDTFVGYYAV